MLSDIVGPSVSRYLRSGSHHGIPPVSGRGRARSLSSEVSSRHSDISGFISPAAPPLLPFPGGRLSAPIPPRIMECAGYLTSDITELG